MFTNPTRPGRHTHNMQHHTHGDSNYCVCEVMQIECVDAVYFGHWG